MAYIDCHLIPVPAGKKPAYLALASRLNPVLRAYGALRVVECWGDALAVDPDTYHASAASGAVKEAAPGMVRGFLAAAGAQPGETVVFSWVEWPDKATRDAGTRQAMQDPRMQPVAGEETVFDGRRMVSGGFQALFEG